MTNLLLGALVGALSSLGVTALWSYLTAPRLVVNDPQRTSVQGEAHFWGARVAMSKPYVFPRRPASAVRAAVSVRDPLTGGHLASYTCRWQGTPQPIVPTGPAEYVPSIPLIPLGQRGEVYQHTETGIDLFVKFDNEPQFYGFPNEAYFHKLRHKDFSFGGTHYYATLTVEHDRDVHVLELEITNPDTSAQAFVVNVRDRTYRSMLGPIWSVG